MVRVRDGVLWWTVGAGVAFSVLALVSIGFFTILPAFMMLLLLSIIRLPGIWMGIAGAGTVSAVLLLSLEGDPNSQSPGMALILVLVGISILGYLIFIRSVARDQPQDNDSAKER